MISEIRTRRGRWIRRAWLAALLVAGLVTPLLSAPATRPRPPRPPGDDGDVRETLQVLMIVSMKKALGLTQDQEMAVIPRIQQVFEGREAYTRQRRHALEMLQSKLMEESIPEREYREAVIRLDDLERAHDDLELRLRGEIDQSLNPRQRAQMRIFVPRFRQQMQMRIDEARRLQARPMDRTRQAPAVEGDWDTGDEEF